MAKPRSDEQPKERKADPAAGSPAPPALGCPHCVRPTALPPRPLLCFSILVPASAGGLLTSPVPQSPWSPRLCPLDFRSDGWGGQMAPSRLLCVSDRCIPPSSCFVTTGRRHFSRKTCVCLRPCLKPLDGCETSRGKHVVFYVRTTRGKTVGLGGRMGLGLVDGLLPRRRGGSAPLGRRSLCPRPRPGCAPNGDPGGPGPRCSW